MLPLTISATTDAVNRVRPNTIAVNIGVISNAVPSSTRHVPGLSGLSLIISGVVMSPSTNTVPITITAPHMPDLIRTALSESSTTEPCRLVSMVCLIRVNAHSSMKVARKAYTLQDSARGIQNPLLL